MNTQQIEINRLDNMTLEELKGELSSSYYMSSKSIMATDEVFQNKVSRGDYVKLYKHSIGLRMNVKLMNDVINAERTKLDHIKDARRALIERKLDVHVGQRQRVRGLIEELNHHLHALT